MKSKILLVEDEKSIQDLVKLNLEIEGYDVIVANNGEEALECHSKSIFSTIVLDVMMPKMDGFSVCKTIRTTDEITPILFLTAKDTEEDRINGLRIGGDDYLAKPFNLEELLLRVANLVKRRGEVVKQVEKSEYVFGVCKIDFAKYEISDKTGSLMQISDREIKLLKLLIVSDGKVVSRNDILDKVWGYEKFPTTRTIDNYILSFRKYFEIDPKKPMYFHSIRGVGYKFTSEG
jgi:two-component system alkaline phosphatase synthesis response regulator PhoP